MQEDGRLKKEQADYQDILARRRQEEKIRKEAEANELNLRKQEESLRQQEAIRRATIEHEMELRRKNDLARVEAEAVHQAKKEREKLNGVGSILQALREPLSVSENSTNLSLQEMP